MSAGNSRIESNLIRLISCQGFFTSPLAVRITLSIIVAALAGFQLGHFFTWSPRMLAVHGAITDDAYFYSVLAHNVYRYGFLTLDGQTPTNGVQPLWMILQIGLVGLFPSASEAKILSQSSWILYVLFSGLTIWWVTQGQSRMRQWGLATVLMSSLITANAGFQVITVKGLETPLMLTLLVSVLLLIDRMANHYQHGGFTVGSSTALAIGAGLCFLARTDLFWIGLIIGGWLILKERKLTLAVATYFSVLFLLVIPYLVFNQVTQGSIVPISGRAKQFYLSQFYPGWSTYFYSEEWRGFLVSLATIWPALQQTRASILAIITTGLVGFAQYLVWRTHSRHLFPTSFRFLSVVVFCHLIFMHGIYHELRPYSSYYFAPELLWLGAVFAYYFSSVLRLSELHPNLKGDGSFKYSLLAWGIAFVSLWNAVETREQFQLNPVRYWQQRLQLAADIQTLLPDQSRVAAIWPGLFAQFSTKNIVPIDGIVGSNEYFLSYVKTNRQFDYLFEHSIPYLAVYLPRHPHELTSTSVDQIGPWNLGVEKLLQRGDINFEVVSARPTSQEGAGWYLIKLTCIESQDKC